MADKPKAKGRKIGRNKVKCERYRERHPGHHKGAVNGSRDHPARKRRPLSITGIF